MVDSTGVQRDLYANLSSQKQQGSSSEEDSSYSKYDKGAPEYKEPIKDFYHKVWKRYASSTFCY